MQGSAHSIGSELINWAPSLRAKSSGNAASLGPRGREPVAKMAAPFAPPPPACPSSAAVACARVRASGRLANRLRIKCGRPASFASNAGVEIRARASSFCSARLRASLGDSAASAASAAEALGPGARAEDALRAGVRERVRSGERKSPPPPPTDGDVGGWGGDDMRTSDRLSVAVLLATAK